MDPGVGVCGKFGTVVTGSITRTMESVMKILTKDVRKARNWTCPIQPASARMGSAFSLSLVITPLAINGLPTGSARGTKS